MKEFSDINRIPTIDNSNIEAKHMLPSEGFEKYMEKSPHDTFKNQELICNAMPQNNGEWDGTPGDSTWNPDSEVTPKQSNEEEKTWQDISKDNEIDGIPFKDGYPIFDEITVAEVEIEDFTTDRGDNFDQADKKLADQWTKEQKDGKDWTPSEVRNYRKENNLTWHEKEDMKTLQLVPSEVHNNIPHSGGIAAKKAEEKFV